MPSHYTGSTKYDEIKKANRICKRTKMHGEDNFFANVDVFKELTQAVPYYAFVVCNHSLYRKQVTIFFRTKHKSFA